MVITARSSGMCGRDHARFFDTPGAMHDLQDARIRKKNSMKASKGIRLAASERPMNSTVSVSF